MTIAKDLFNSNEAGDGEWATFDIDSPATVIQVDVANAAVCNVEVYGRLDGAAGEHILDTGLVHGIHEVPTMPEMRVTLVTVADEELVTVKARERG